MYTVLLSAYKNKGALSNKILISKNLFNFTMPNKVAKILTALKVLAQAAKPPESGLRYKYNMYLKCGTLVVQKCPLQM